MKFVLFPGSRVLLSAYYWSTLPHRRLRNAREARRGRAPVAVLFYHRVADFAPNRWTISNRRFRRQIRWLRKHFALISLAEAQRRIRSGSNREAAVCITFDDGYADNCQQALPLVIREKIPVTYFVTSQNVLDGQPFEHDLQAGQPLRPNTVKQLRELVSAGVELGAHTRTHPDLGLVTDREQLREEIVSCRDELESALDCRLRYFAFPYGLPENLSPAGFALARETGYDGVCSAYGGYNFPGDDPFHLQRIHADPEMIRLKNWLTVDPRKTDFPRFNYNPAAPAAGADDPITDH